MAKNCYSETISINFAFVNYSHKKIKNEYRRNKIIL